MEDLPSGITAALVPEFAVKDLPLGRTLTMTLKEKIKQNKIQNNKYKYMVNGNKYKELK